MEDDDLPVIKDYRVCTYSLDGFLVNGLRRYTASWLRKHFLPQMTRKAKKLLRDPNFVFNQFQHYDLEYDRSQHAGSDVVQLKRALAAGKLDEVPSEMRQIEKEMELQWLAALSPTHLTSDPELYVEKRFLDQSGDLAPHKLDAGKLVTVEYSSSQVNLAARLIQAANEVDGLYALGARSEPHQVFISRNENLVRAAAGITEVRNARLLDLAQKKADAEEQHKRLLEMAEIAADTEHRHSVLLNSDTYSPSPVGRYTVDAPRLNGVTCPGPRRLSVCISALDTSTSPRNHIYQASFDLRVAKGVMILSPNLHNLYNFCRQKWTNDIPAKAQEYDSDAENEGGDDDERADVPLRYHALLRYRETRTGAIHFIAEKGMLKFTDEDQLEFSARVDLSTSLGLKVEMMGRKVCDVEEVPTERWRDFTRARYNHEHAARMRLL